MRELLEEARADRPRPDERHVPAQDVPELRDLVELRCLQPAADSRQLRVGAADELLAQVLPDPVLGAGAERAELQHLEEAAAAADPLAAVEDRPPARDEQHAGDQEPDRSEEDPEEAREEDVEQTQLEVDPAMLRLGREPCVPADEGVLERWRRRCHPVDGRPSGCERPRNRPRAGRRSRGVRGAGASVLRRRCSASRSFRSRSRCGGRGGCWFRAGEQELHVGVDRPFAPARKAHPGLVVSDLARARRPPGGRRRSPSSRTTRIPGTKRFHAADPFGNRLEFREA